MHDAQLDLGLRVDRLDGVGESGEPVHAADQHVAHPAVLQLVEDPHPELGALRAGEPQAQKLLLALHVHAQGQVDRAVAHLTVLAALDHDRVQIHDRVDRVQRPRLPGFHVVQHRVGHRGDQRRRHLHLVQLVEVLLDLPGGHAPRVQTDDPIVESVETLLAFADDLRLELALAVPRHLQLHLAALAGHRLLPVTVAAVAAALALRSVLGVTEVLGHLAFQRTLK